ncbi:MAG: hypothetical protein V4555_01640 [Acidobacteriota bacterium]
MGSYNGGTLLCFDPRAKQFVPIPQLSTEFRHAESIITDIAQAPNGFIYYGTYPGGHLVRYDPDTRVSTDLGQVSQDEMYLRWLAVSPSGTVLCGMGPRHSRVIAYDPSTKSFHTLTPAADQTPGAFSKPLVTARFVVEAQHRPAGRVLVYDAATFKLLHVFSVPQRNNGSGNQSAFILLDQRHLLYQGNDQRLMSLNLEDGSRAVVFRSPGTAANNRWYLDSRGNILGLLVQSYVYLNPRTQKVTYATIPLDHPAQEIRWLSAAPNGNIYGGPVLGQTFFSFNPSNRSLLSYDQVNDRTGEIYYGIALKGRIYTISYAEAGLSVFDPKKAWRPGESISSNPRAIAYLPDGQYRPEGGLHIGPGGNIYIGTQPDYGLLGGALTVFNPSTERLHVYRNIIPQEEITAIATDSRYIYCASDVEGGGGSKPEATQVHFFVWDPASHAIVWDHAFPDARGINALAVSNGHVYFVRDDQLMDFNLKAHSLVAVYHFDHAASVPSESLKIARDGSIFGIFGNEVGRYSPASGSMQLFPETRGHATSGLELGTDGAVYFGNHTDMWIYMPDHPSPPASFGQ